MTYSYRESFKIRMNEADTKGFLRPDALTGLLQETAGNHAKKLQFDIADLQEKNCTWILHKLHFKMNGYPRWRDTITIETWPSSGNRLLAYRDFRILNQQNELLGLAVSHWIIFDLIKKRPVRISNSILKLGADIEEHVLPVDSDIVTSSEKDLKVRNRFEVHFSDLDMNNHLNNTVYVRCILDSLPVKTAEAGYCKELIIKFKSEATYGNRIKSCLAGLDDSAYTHKLFSEDSSSCHAEANSVWKSMKSLESS